MGLETIALVAGTALQAGSSAYGAYTQNQANNRFLDFQNRMARRAGGFLQDEPYAFESQIQELLGAGPSQYETQLLDFLAGGGVPTNQAFNTGQDALSQMIRTDPYDLTSYFNALNPVEQRLIDQQVSGLRGSASGLGQRFGSALLNAETDLRTQAAENQAARREQLGFQAFETAQARQANAAQALANLGFNQQQLATNTQLTGYNQLFGAEQGRRGFEASLLQLLAQAAQGRQANNVNILGLMQGFAPQGGASPFAAAGGEVGQLLMFLPLLQRLIAQGGAPGGTPTGVTPGLATA